MKGKATTCHREGEIVAEVAPDPITRSVCLLGSKPPECRTIGKQRNGATLIGRGMRPRAAMPTRSTYSFLRMLSRSMGRRVETWLRRENRPLRLVDETQAVLLGPTTSKPHQSGQS